jgi:hypothetical protein
MVTPDQLQIALSKVGRPEALQEFPGREVNFQAGCPYTK